MTSATLLGFCGLRQAEMGSRAGTARWGYSVEIRRPEMGRFRPCGLAAAATAGGDSWHWWFF
jgi:hypothetical protein